MGFLSQWDALGGAGDALVKARVELLGGWLSRQQVAFMKELVLGRPVFETDTPLGTFVMKYADVQEVLTRPTVFSTRLYAPRMERIAGPFFIAEEDTPDRVRQLAILSLTMPREDVAGIQQAARTLIAGVLQGAVPRRRLDVVPELARVVPAAFLETYFGTPGPDRATLLAWTQAMFHEIFYNLFNDPAVTAAAVDAGSRLRGYVDGLLAGRGTALAGGAPPAATLVDRLLHLQGQPETRLDSVTIREILIGMMVAAVENTATAICNVLNLLLDRPEVLGRAQRAVATGDDALLTQIVYEAWRLAPVSTMVVRACEQPYTVARGRPWQTTIQPNTMVWAGLASAMFDPDRLDAPEEFRTDRVIDYDYMHFGYGPHLCYGRYAGHAHVMESLRGLLGLPNLRRAAGSDGVLQVAGSFPAHFMVEFDPTPAQP